LLVAVHRAVELITWPGFNLAVTVDTPPLVTVIAVLR
jgi:hypothetical protein